VVDVDKLESLTRELLLAIGEDPNREGLADTPVRFAKWWKEFIDFDAGKVGTAFALDGVDQMVCVTGMEVWSLCEHHLLPFTATVNVAYIPKDEVLGLSKFARIAHKNAHKLQIQERLALDIANDIESLTGAVDLAVVIDGVHSCMASRGIRTKGSMRTSVMRGVFKSEADARAEFLSLVDKGL
jgi:GTP cyclohydrolase I